MWERHPSRLGDQPRFPDPRLAQEENGPRAPVARRLLRRATKGDELPLASDEDWAWTELAAGDLRPQADEPERQDRLLLALCEDRFDGFDVDKVPEQPVRRFAQEDLAGRSVLLE